MAEPQSLRRWDVICRVVDHYGDAGVCLRVARGLAAAPGREVRLLVDRPAVVLELIQPRPEPLHHARGPAQQERANRAADQGPASPPTTTDDPGLTWLDRSGVRICGWDTPPDEAEVVLETFGSELPSTMLEDMRTKKASGLKVPVWLNLEHLSAEDWVEGCHGLPSPQAGGLTRWFLFPGFTQRTAGLPGPQAPVPVLPPDLLRLIRGEYHATVHHPAPQDGEGATGPRNEPATAAAAMRPMTGSVFCYHDSPLPALLDAMQGGPAHVRLAIPVGMPGDLGGRVLGDAPGSAWHSDHLTLVRIPFVDQDLYDRVLSACDFNIVRGEDSFVRAQWAGRPLLWAAYREPGAAHLDKLAAWLERCQMPPDWASLHGWFNGGLGGQDTVPSDLWRNAVTSLSTAQKWAMTWREHLLMLPDLNEELGRLALHHVSRIQ